MIVDEPDDLPDEGETPSPTEQFDTGLAEKFCSLKEITEKLGSLVVTMLAMHCTDYPCAWCIKARDLVKRIEKGD